MTDLLLKPEDTGEIPRTVPGEKTVRIVGEATQRLNPMIATAPFPALRRSDATGEIPRYDVTLLINGTTVAPAQPAGKVIWQAPPAKPETYLGRHRRPSRWDWLTVPLAIAVQRIVGAM